MLKFFRILFAQSGDLAAVPDDTQVGGEVSYDQGYGPDYASDPSGGPPAKRIERDQYNQILRSVTAAIQEQQSQGLPDHITSALNDGSPFAYDIGATVFQPIDNKVYRNTVAANVTVPPNTGWLDITTPLTLATLPDGTTSQKGIVQLVDSVGASTTLAATQKIATRLGSTSQQGQLQLSNSDTSTSTTLAATIGQVTKRARKAATETISAIWTFAVSPVLNFLPSNPKLSRLLPQSQGVVNSGGILLAGRDITVIRIGQGNYQVNFTSIGVTANLFVSTLVVSSSVFIPRTIQYFPDSTTQITVLTYDPAGVLADSGFTVGITNLGA